MKPMYLEDITYYKNIEEGYCFTPINATFRYLEEWIKKDVIDLAKILLVVKQLELCEKYGFVVDSFILENYLTSKDSIYEIEDVYEFIENSGICENDKMTIQHLFTDEFMNYFDELDQTIRSTSFADIIEKLYIEAKGLVKEKYNYELEPLNLQDDKGHYKDFINHLIQSEIIISYEEPKTVLARIEQEKHKIYTKGTQNTANFNPYEG